MIVWIASFPRSGNTFLRILLHRFYNVRAAVIYDHDGVADRLGAEFVGFVERVGTLDDMRAAGDVHFIKTHAQHDERVDVGDGVLCLVRDGRDALVSWARQRSEADPRGFENELAARINEKAPHGTGSWGRNVLSWISPDMPRRIVLRYEDLIAAPAKSVDAAVSALQLDMPRVPGAAPRFDELRKHDKLFFRRGEVGAYRDEMPQDLQALFWSKSDNAAAMERLGYGRYP